MYAFTKAYKFYVKISTLLQKCTFFLKVKKYAFTKAYKFHVKKQYAFTKVHFFFIGKKSTLLQKCIRFTKVHFFWLDPQRQPESRQIIWFKPAQLANLPENPDSLVSPPENPDSLVYPPSSPENPDSLVRSRQIIRILWWTNQRIQILWQIRWLAGGLNQLISSTRIFWLTRQMG